MDKGDDNTRQHAREARHRLAFWLRYGWRLAAVGLLVAAGAGVAGAMRPATVTATAVLTVAADGAHGQTGSVAQAITLAPMYRQLALRPEIVAAAGGDAVTVGTSTGTPLLEVSITTDDATRAAAEANAVAEAFTTSSYDSAVAGYPVRLLAPATAPLVPQSFSGHLKRGLIYGALGAVVGVVLAWLALAGWQWWRSAWADLCREGATGVWPAVATGGRAAPVVEQSAGRAS